MAGRTVSRREWMLLVGLAVAGGIWLYDYARRDVGLFRGGSPVEAGAAGAVNPAEAPVVWLGLLSRAGPVFEAGARDLFQYAQRPPSAEEIRHMQEQEAQRRREAEEAAQRAALEAEQRRIREQEQAQARALLPPPPPTPPAIGLRFIAVIGPPKDKIAVFESGRDLLLAKKGETVQGEFKLVDIKYESVIMGYTRKEFRDRTQELPMMRGEGRR